MEKLRDKSSAEQIFTRQVKVRVQREEESLEKMREM